MRWIAIGCFTSTFFKCFKISFWYSKTSKKRSRSFLMARFLLTNSGSITDLSTDIGVPEIGSTDMGVARWSSSFKSLRYLNAIKYSNIQPATYLSMSYVNDEDSKQPLDVHESLVMLIIDSSSFMSFFTSLPFSSFFGNTFLSLNARAPNTAVSDDFPAFEIWAWLNENANVFK